MVNIKPGKQIKIRESIKHLSAAGLVLNADHNTLTIGLFSNPDLSPGDEIELEATEWEDALYIMPARVLNKEDNHVCTLQIIKKIQRFQRRKSERIPTNLQTDYSVLKDKVNSESLQSIKQGRILDISRDGALLAVEEPIAVSSQIVLKFEITLRNKKIVSTGVVGSIAREHKVSEDPSPEEEFLYGVKFQKPLPLLAG